MDSQWRLIASPQLTQDPSSLAQSLGDSFRATFDIAQKLNSRACAVVASDLSSTTVDWVSLLLQPVIEQQFDLVTPCYARHPFEGMINRAIVYPLVRALYGKQIRNPMGPDFGVSSRLLQRIAGAPRRGCIPFLRWPPKRSPTECRCASRTWARAFMPLRILPTSVRCWRRCSGRCFSMSKSMRRTGSGPAGRSRIREFGQPMYVERRRARMDVSRLIESFQLGARNLQEVWGIILPPSTWWNCAAWRATAHRNSACPMSPGRTWFTISRWRIGCAPSAATRCCAP
jgi:glucosylglycerate synthase